jgi:hypothetical protein
MGDIELRKKQQEFLNWMAKTAEEDSKRKREIASRPAHESFKVDLRCSKTRQNWIILLKKNVDGNFEIERTLTTDIRSQSEERLGRSSPKSVTVGIDQIRNHSSARCPYCGDGGWVKCGCGKLSCQGGVTKRDGREWHVCPWCDKGGYIEGTFETIDGEMDDKRRIPGPKEKQSLPRGYKALPP